MENNKTEIGVVHLSYNEQGQLISGYFEPTLKVQVPSTMFREINSLNEERLKSDADHAFSTWFSRMTDIELHDPSEYKLESEVLKCKEFTNNRVQECQIKYYLTKL